MKFGAIKNALFTTSLLLAAAYSGSAAAHPSPPGTINNNTLAGSTEAWNVTCSDPATTQVYLDVRYTTAIGNAATPGVLTATVTKGTVGRSVMDDTTGALPGAGILTGAGGTGTYLVTIQRTTAGAVLYLFNFHCANAAGVEVAGAPTFSQVINN